MKRKLLFLVTILGFILGCSKEKEVIDNNKSRIYKNLLLGTNTTYNYDVSEGCKDMTVDIFAYREVTLYNHAYQKLLTAEGSTAGTWDGARVWLDRWYIDPMWKHAQQWSFREYKLEPKYGGWVYAISNKIGWGQWRDLALSITGYGNGGRATYPVKLFRSPDVASHAGSFEFILTECRREGKHPRGLLVHRGTDRLVQVIREEYSDTPIVRFGEKYNPNKQYSDDIYLWEAEPRGWK